VARFILVVGLMVALASSAASQDWVKERLKKDPRPRVLKWVFEEGGYESYTKYLVVRPRLDAPTPLVVVLHGSDGLGDWERLLCNELADAGFIAIAPDLLSGLGANNGGTAELAGPDAVRKAMQYRLPKHCVGMVIEAVNCAARIPQCNGKVFLVGFGRGGEVATRFAAIRKSVKATLVFDWNSPIEEAVLKNVECPVYGFYAGSDATANAAVPMLKVLMTSAGKTFDPLIYDGATPNFIRDGEAPDASDANRKARDAAWSRCMELLAGS